MSQDDSYYFGISLVLREVNQKSYVCVYTCVISYKIAQCLQFAGNDQWNSVG